jgi:hypothetical protein
VIRKSGGKYTLYSKKSGKALSKPGTKAAAQKRERQVNYFKHKKS